MIHDGQLLNYVGGEWRRSHASESLDVRNPATAETIVRVPLTPPGEVDEAAQLAQTAWTDWRRTPPTERIQYLFKLKRLLDEHFEEIARLTVDECGKTLAEAQGELRRGIENVEVATGIPSLMMGYNVEDIARGIDEHMLRQPRGRRRGDHTIQLSRHDPRCGSCPTPSLAGIALFSSRQKRCQ